MFTFTNLMETYAARLCVRRQRCCCQAHAVAPVQLVPFIDDAEPTGHAAGHSRTVVNVKDIYGIPPYNLRQLLGHRNHPSDECVL